MDSLSVSSLVREVLGREDIPETANLHRLGLDSLKSVQLIWKLQDRLGVAIDGADILRNPTIANLNMLLRNRGSTPLPPRITPVPGRSRAPPSAIQSALLALDQATGGQGAVCAPELIDFGADLDASAAAAAFGKVLSRHDVLRTTFPMDAGKTIQEIRALEALPRFFRCSDLRDADNSINKSRELLDAEAHIAFDLTRGPLARFHLVKLPEERSVGFVSVHHLVCDGFSMGIIEREFRFFYDQIVAGPSRPESCAALQDLPFHYHDYADWLAAWSAGADGQRALNRLVARLCSSGCRQLFPKHGASFPSFATSMCYGEVAPEIRARLIAASSAHEVTLFTVLVACLQILMSALTDRSRPVLGVAFGTRDLPGLAGQVGPYVNVLPMGSGLPDELTFRALLKAVSAEQLALQADKLAPIEEASSRAGLVGPVFDVGFTLEKQRDRSPLERQITQGFTASAPLTVKLLFVAVERPSCLDLKIRYRTDCFTFAEVQIIRALFDRVVTALTDSADQPIKPIYSRLLGRSIDIDLDLDV
jgi:acyl carrier protein